MASKARQAFDANAEDVDRLLALHEREGGDAPGRRYGLQVLNKSAIVLITAYWEAYCEDIAAEGLEHLVTHLKDAVHLPVTLKRQIAKELKSDQNELALWKVADSGWRDVLMNRLANLREQRDRKLNTPKTMNIKQLFSDALGISDVSAVWHWPKKMTIDRARKKLDKYISLRGEIAHRGRPETSVTKTQVTDYFKFIKKVVANTGDEVNRHVKDLTGRKLW